MGKRVHILFEAASVLDLQKVGQIFPVDLDAKILKQLDDCARNADLRPVFAKQTRLDEVRFQLFTYLETRIFRREFLKTFANLLPAMMEAVNERAKFDDLRLFDLSAFAARLGGSDTSFQPA